MIDEIFCPSCGEEMNHWNQGIYECECGCMIDGEVYEEMGLDCHAI
ncbi:hypothetical protein VQL36_16155 [Chengkuizengella sp. SCS-71B]